MKFCLTVVSLVLLTLSLTAQGTRGQNVPEVVKEQFLTDFKGAVNMDWNNRNKYYAVSFHLGKYDMEALYSGTGLWLYTEIDLPLEDVPARAVEHCNSTYGASNVINSGYHDEKGDRYYRIHVLVNSEEKIAKYSDSGDFMALE